MKLLSCFLTKKKIANKILLKEKIAKIIVGV